MHNEKWKSVIDSIGLTGSKAQWMSQYAELHSKEEKLENFDKHLLPIAMKVASQTIGLDLVAVKPLSTPSFGNSKEELERIKGEVVSTNRDGKIESIIEDKEYKEMEIKDHPDYKKSIFYMDYVYGGTSSVK